MRRKISSDLSAWLAADGRKPLVLRGARQVGKTWVVRELAAASDLDLVEINFERNPEYGEVFASARGELLVAQLEAVLGRAVTQGESLLFLDEVQECPEVLGALRWLYEDLPGLPVVAAGSLLEFALQEHDFNMPVGRISYMFMGPMSYIEFLWACGEERLADYICSASAGEAELTDAVHGKAMELFRQYCLCGGMPEAVKTWSASRDPGRVGVVQQDLLLTYRDDFNKYRRRVSAEVMRKTMASVARQLGGKFNYSRVDDSLKHAQVKAALEMLVKARLCSKVTSSSGNGVPLGAESNERIFKCVFLDVGLAMAQLGMRPATARDFEECVWSNKGAVAEQVVGQLLLAGAAPRDMQLFFWQQSGSGTGEVDYLVQRGSQVLPVEVKSGASGSMKSLHSFMARKGLSAALRLDTNKPSRQHMDLRTTRGEHVEYDLVSLPLYMAELATAWV